MRSLNLTDELILTIFNEVQSQYGYNATVPKRYVHKIIFRLREEFPEDNNLFDSAPFYWYYYGPFSELISESLQNLLVKQIIKISNKFYILNKEVNRLNQIKDYEDVIHELIAKYSVYNNEKLVKDIYYGSAPLEFIPSYKIEVLDPLEKNFDKINSNNFYKYINPKEIVDMIYSCESKLPFEQLFRGFNVQFSTFSMILDNLYEDFIFDYFPTTFEAIRLVWNTFAQALRVVKHDNYKLYNSKKIIWTNIYYKKLSESRNVFKTLNEVENSKTMSSDVKISELEGNILLSSVGKYISD